MTTYETNRKNFREAAETFVKSPKKAEDIHALLLEAFFATRSAPANMAGSGLTYVEIKKILKEVEND